MIQVFESWAHQMIPSQFETFAKPYADLAMSILKQRHPDVPVIYFANGGSSYLESQRDTQVGQGHSRKKELRYRNRRRWSRLDERELSNNASFHFCILRVVEILTWV